MMKSMKMVLALAIVGMVTSTALATGSSKKCTKTTKKCEKKYTKPLKGYGNQCWKKSNYRYRMWKQYWSKCGCGSVQKQDKDDD